MERPKNDEIISQNQKLLARLEKLENIALKFREDFCRYKRLISSYKMPNLQVTKK